MPGSRRPVLIDWRDVTEGSPDLDVALTALVLAQAAAEEDAAATAGALLGAFIPPQRIRALVVALPETLCLAGAQRLLYRRGRNSLLAARQNSPPAR